jgi:hypothetical protein
MAQYREGQRLKGSDGNIYVVTNGVPVRASSPFAKPTLPYEGPQAQATLTRTQQEIAQANATAAAIAEKAKADARKAEADARISEHNANTMESGITAPGDTSKTGEDYLKTIPEGLAGQVRALAEGRRAFPTGTALKDPQIQELIAAATQYDPTLDAANAATRVATRKDFTSGPTSKNITSLNTALGHLGTLKNAADQLENRSFPMWNTLANAAETAVGDPRVKNFTIARDAVANELMRVFRGASSGSMQEIEEWKNTIDSADSPAQLHAAIGKAVELLDSRLQALGDQYNRGLGQSKDPITLLSPHAQAVYNALGPGGNGNVPPPDAGGGGRPQIGGGPQQSLVGGNPLVGSTRSEYDPVTSAGIDSLIRRGRPFEEAQAYVQSQGGSPIDRATYLSAVAYHRQHPEDKGSFAVATKDVPTTAFQRLAGGPVGGFLGGVSNAATAGFNDEIAGGLSALAGGNYQQARDAFNANKNILAEQNPTSDLLGNVTGGVTGMLAGGEAAARLAPGAVDALQASRFAPAIGDAAYGSLYGAGQNNEDRVSGAIGGALAGAGGGMFGRTATKALGRVIAPVAGAAAPLYDRGVFPTIGQRMGMAQGPIASRVGGAVNTIEQALQSVPGLGILPASARNGARKEFQVGAYNEALSPLGLSLPAGANPGTEAYSFTKKALGNAYDTARGNMQFVADAPYTQDIGNFQKSLTDGTLTADQARQITDAIGSSLNGRVQNGMMNGDNYKAAVSDISRKAALLGKNPSTAPQAQYLNNFAAILDNAARRNSAPEASALLDAADNGYANFARIRNASARGGAAKDAGTFSPVDYAAAVKQEGGGIKSDAYSRGGALGQDYAQAGLGLRDILPDSGTPARLLTAQGLEGATLGATHLGGILTNPVTLGMFAPYAFGKLGRKAIAPRGLTLPPSLADPMNLLGNGIYDRADAVGRIAAPATLGYFSGQ